MLGLGKKSKHENNFCAERMKRYKNKAREQDLKVK